MLLAVKILAGLAFIGSLVWLIALPDYEPAIVVITSLSTLIGSFVLERRQIERVKQSQVVSGQGVGLQAGGDISVGKIKNKHT